MSYPGSSHVEMDNCRVCHGLVDPDLAVDGMHPDCEAQNYRENLL